MKFKVYSNDALFSIFFKSKNKPYLNKICTATPLIGLENTATNTDQPLQPTSTSHSKLTTNSEPGPSNNSANESPKTIFKHSTVPKRNETNSFETVYDYGSKIFFKSDTTNGTWIINDLQSKLELESFSLWHTAQIKSVLTKIDKKSKEDKTESVPINCNLKLDKGKKSKFLHLYVHFEYESKNESEAHQVYQAQFRVTIGKDWENRGTAHTTGKEIVIGFNLKNY